MVKSNQYKKQHWIPQSYLKAWCDPNSPADQEPYVWRVSKDGQITSKKAPKNIFFEQDIYSISLPNGNRDLVVEHDLAGLESEFVKVRERLLANRRPLDKRSDIILKAFIAAMKARTPQHLKHRQKQFRNISERMINMRQIVSSMTPKELEEFKKGIQPTFRSEKKISLEEIQQLAESPMGPFVLEEIKIQLPILSKMKLLILCTGDDLGFITSDNPCVWFDPELSKLPPLLQSPGLAFPTIEVTLPVSPSQLILLSWENITGYLDITEEILNDLNRQRRSLCKEYFICKRNEKREIWFNKSTYHPG